MEAEHRTSPFHRGLPRLNWSRVVSHSLACALASLAVLVFYLLLAHVLNSAYQTGLPTSSPVLLALIVILVVVIVNAQQNQVRHARRYAQLSRALSQAVTSAATPEQLLSGVLPALAQFLGVRRAIAFLYDDETVSYSAVQSIGIAAQTAVAVRFDPTDHVARWLRETRPLLDLLGRPGRDFPTDLTHEERARLGALEASLIVGLRLKGQLTGWVAFGPRVRPNEETDLLVSLADQLAIAVENAQLQARNELRARQLNTLIDIAKAITSTLDLDGLLRFVTTRVGELLKSDAVMLFLTNGNVELQLQSLWGGWRPAGADEDEPGLDSLTGVRIPLGQGITGAVARTRKPILAREAVGDPRFWQEPLALRMAAPRSIVCVPLSTRDSVVGVLAVMTRQGGRRFDDTELHLLTFLSDHVAIAIDNARLYTLTDRALTATVAELSTMSEVDRQLNTTLDFRNVLDLTLDWAMRVTQAELGLIGSVGDEDERCDVWVYHGMLDEGRPPTVLKRTPVGSWETQGRLTNDLDLQPGAVRLGDRSRSQLVAPVTRHDRVLAFICLEKAGPSGFDRDDLDFLARLADHAGIAIENSRLYADIKKANEAKSEFVSIVSHELKIPMTSIKGYAKLLSLGTVGDISRQQLDFLKVITRNVDRMDHLVTSLLDLSRLDAGRVRLEPQAVPVTQIVEDSLSQLRDQIAERRQQVTLFIPNDLPPIWADPTRIGQVVTNLISNASKYTLEGGNITIRGHHPAPRCPVDSEGDPDVSRLVGVEIQDSGIGISEEDQARIFSPFFRADNASSQGAQGTGLGLSLTRRLVELHRGRIWFRSRLNYGSTFTFTIPVADEANA